MVKRKNLLPTFLITILSWLGFLSLIIFTSPASPLLLIAFYLLLFLSLFLTLSLIFANSRQGLILTTGLVVFLFLRQTQMANYLNLILLAGILFSLEVYLRKR